VNQRVRKTYYSNMDVKDKVLWTQKVMSPAFNSYPCSLKPWQQNLRYKKANVQYSDYYLNRAGSGCVGMANKIIAKHGQRGMNSDRIQNSTLDDLVMKKIESLATASSIRKESRDMVSRAKSLKVRKN
jgi:hypothetical protein